MAITISSQDNPNTWLAGTIEGEATIINSGFSNGTVLYEIDRVDGDGDPMLFGSTDANSERFPQVVSSSAATLKIILPFRTSFKVRVNQNGGAFSSWKTFKTRDKKYSSPGAITQLSVVQSETSAGANVIVTNSAKATETATSAGATVVNTDKSYVNVTSITAVSTGERIVHTNKETQTSSGSTINNL